MFVPVQQNPKDRQSGAPKGGTASSWPALYIAERDRAGNLVEDRWREAVRDIGIGFFTLRTSRPQDPAVVANIAEDTVYEVNKRKLGQPVQKPAGLLFRAFRWNLLRTSRREESLVPLVGESESQEAGDEGDQAASIERHILLQEALDMVAQDDRMKRICLGKMNDEPSWKIAASLGMSLSNLHTYFNRRIERFRSLSRTPPGRG